MLYGLHNDSIQVCVRLLRVGVQDSQPFWIVLGFRFWRFWGLGPWGLGTKIKLWDCWEFGAGGLSRLQTRSSKAFR